MALPLQDPHVARGIEDAQRDVPPYRWQDPEHQRRYDLGYLTGRGERPAPGLSCAELTQRMRELGYAHDR